VNAAGRPPGPSGAAHLSIEVDATSYRTLADFAYEVLRQNILEGTLAPATRLVESDLALQLQVSRVPVREAIRRLAEAGFLELRPHGRGAVVVETTEDGLHDFLELRTGLESWAAQLAAERISEDELNELREIQAEGLSCAEEGDFERSRECGRLWHDALARASGNREVVRMLSSIDARIAWRSQDVVAARGTATWVEHQAVIDALQRRDAPEAARLIRHHMEQHERLRAVRFAER
jgi:DNA-binding GntR family transcriptional regulator